ncbi:MAG: TIGR03032 family protein [Planctomycetales bacterium]|nr:TIGR03032 family protein [Planctomycetales bacterium]
MGQGTDHPPPASSPQGSRLRCRAHGKMAAWLAASGGSLAITTYTSGKLILVSSFAGKIGYRLRPLARPMGLATRDGQLAVATRTQLLQFRNTLEQRPTPPRHGSDAVFTLDQGFPTGKLNAHDLAFGNRGLYFANTRFNCIARATPKKRFLCVWQPPFLEAIVPQDCCHLNGIGLRDGRPAMATAFCETAQPGGWREENRFTQGVLLDVQESRVVARGLCMPHSPRWHNDCWWLCDSGHGTLVRFDAATTERREVCSLPGFTRGLCLIDKYALVGLSKIRRKHVLDAPPVRERHARLFAGVALVDTSTGRQLGSLEFLTGGREVFEVVFLPGVRRPNVIVN